MMAPTNCRGHHFNQCGLGSLLVDIHSPIIVIGLCIAIQLDPSGLTIDFLLSVSQLLMTTVNHWPLLWITKVTTDSLGHITGLWIIVSTVRALVTDIRRLEVALVTTLEAMVDRGVRS